MGEVEWRKAIYFANTKEIGTAHSFVLTYRNRKRQPLRAGVRFSQHGGSVATLTGTDGIQEVHPPTMYPHRWLECALFVNS